MLETIVSFQIIYIFLVILLLPLGCLLFYSNIKRFLKKEFNSERNSEHKDYDN